MAFDDQDKQTARFVVDYVREKALSHCCVKSLLKESFLQLLQAIL